MVEEEKYRGEKDCERRHSSSSSSNNNNNNKKVFSVYTKTKRELRPKSLSIYTGYLLATGIL